MMPSKMRIQYEGARYHVINRGNYRSDVFAAKGAAESFMRTLEEAAGQYAWKVHAYAIMRNHYHLAIEMPKANLSKGMHWLQCTFASRFNRFRKQSGRLFQGPYKALPIEDVGGLCRVVDYIHLNPVRAGAVAPANVRSYAWSSLNVFSGKKSMAWLTSGEWLSARGWKATPKGMRAYEEYLIGLGKDEAAQKEAGLIKLSEGWAIGTEGWKRALAKEYAQRRAVSGRGLGRDELVEIRRAQNENALERALKKAGRAEAELKTKPRMQKWKVEVALEMRKEGVPVTWLAERLQLGKATSLRTHMWQARRQKVK